jgi:hypothetical protein
MKLLYAYNIYKKNYDKLYIMYKLDITATYFSYTQIQTFCIKQME